ncbi:MAG: MFS transporter [Actinobacteria bacterium]|nr:MFS transporter [Actinomycetota bacterium]
MREKRKGRTKEKTLYYGWVVVAVAFLAMFVNYGVRSTQTVLIKGFSSELDIGRAAASLPFTVSVLVYAFLAPLTGRLVDRFGPRWVMACGALLSGVGLWLCSRAHSLWALTFFFGFVFGVGGNGVGLVPSNTSVAMWFRRRLGLALGMATMGIGFGTMILPRLTGLVQAHSGWRASFQFLGYVALALTVPVLLFLKRGAGKGEEPEEESASGLAGGKGVGMPAAQDEPLFARENSEGHVVGEGSFPSVSGMVRRKGEAERYAASDTRGSRKGPGVGAGTRGERVEDGGEHGGLTLGEAFRTASFWYLFLGFVLIVVALYGIMVHQVPYATDRGISREWAEWSVFLYGATSILGRVFFGRLSDRTREKKNALYPACFILAASIFLLLTADRPWLLMLFAAVFGFGFAAYGPVIPAVCAEVFGKGSMGAIFGAVTTGGALGGAFGPVLTGFIFDRTGGYVGAWILALACVAVSTLLFTRVKVMIRGDRSPRRPEG